MLETKEVEMRFVFALAMVAALCLCGESQACFFGKRSVRGCGSSASYQTPTPTYQLGAIPAPAKVEAPTAPVPVVTSGNCANGQCQPAPARSFKLFRGLFGR
jgi:hypothetical protein